MGEERSTETPPPSSPRATNVRPPIPGPRSPLPDSRPPLGPRRVHPAWIAIGAIGWLRALGLPLLIALVSGGDRYSQIVYAGAIALAVAVTAIRIVEWSRLRYAVVGGDLRVTSGLLSRQERLVPLERIQAVDINENLLQRLFGVVGVKIETAAGGMTRTDVNLEALKRSDALALRERLAVGRPATDAAHTTQRVDQDATAPAGPALADRSELIRAITPFEVVIAGATSARIGPALAIVIGALEMFDAALGRAIAGVFGVERGFTLTGAVFLLAVLAAGGWLLAIVSAVLTYSGFEVRRDGDRLLIHHGLLDRRRRTIPIARIQAIRVSEGLLRQPFGLVAVQFDSAGYGRSAADSGTLFPLLPRAQVAALIAAACPAYAAEPTRAPLNRPPRRARPRYILRPVWGVVLAGTLATALAAWLPSVAWWWGAAVLAAVPPAALLGLWQYHDTGWAADGDQLIVRGRSLGRTTAITLRRRLQHVTVQRTFFQRRARLATFAAAIASGGQGRTLSIAHLDEGVAFGIAGMHPSPVQPGR